MASGATAAAPRVEVSARSGPSRNKISRPPGHARTVPPWVFRAGVHRIESRATRARCSATLELDRYGRSCGVSAENARLAARFFLASETILARAVNPFQWRPRTRRRCLTPHAVMNPAAYPDNRWSTGSHATSGARPVTQRCDSPCVAPSSSLLHPPPTRQYSQHSGALFRGQRQRTPRGGRPAVARRPDRAAHPTNIAGKHSTTGSTCSASYSRCAAPVHAPSPVKEQRSHVPPFPAPENFSPRQTNPSTDPSSIIPRADAGARAHVRARHRVVPARALRRRLPRQRVRARQPAAAV